MIVICEDCGKKYRIIPEKVRKYPARFSCIDCEHQIIVNAPEDSDSLQNEIETSESLSLPEPEDIDTEFSSPEIKEKEITSPETEFDPKRTGFGLKGKLIALMLVVSLVPLIIYWWISFSQTTKRLREDSEALFSQVTIGLIGQVDEWIDKNIRILKTIANLDDMLSMDRTRQEELLKAIRTEYPWIYLTFTTDTHGMNIARNDSKPLKDYSDRRYYKDIIAGNEISWQTLVGKTSGRPTMVLAVPIKRKDGMTVGVLASAMTIESLSNKMGKWTRGKTGHAFLVDETGKVVAHQVKRFVLEQKNLNGHPLVKEFQKGHQGVLYFKNENNEPYLGAIRKTKYGWALAIEQAEKEVFIDLHHSRFIAMIIFGITVIFVVVLAIITGKAFVTPIKKLTEIADRISVGELDLEIKIKSRDEIALLGDAIGRLQDSIRLSIERARRRK